MAKKKNGAAREAARRAAQPAKPAPVRTVADLIARQEAAGTPVLDVRPSAPAPGTSRRDRRPPDEVAAERLRKWVRSTQIVRARLDLEERQVDELVIRLRGFGWTWDQIAEQMGVTRQAVIKRSTRREKR